MAKNEKPPMSAKLEAQFEAEVETWTDADLANIKGHGLTIEDVRDMWRYHNDPAYRKSLKYYTLEELEERLLGGRTRGK